MWCVGVCSVVFSSSSKKTKEKDPKKIKIEFFLNEQTERARSKHTRTFGAGQRADRPHGTPTERIVPVGVAGGAGGADGQTARSQVHHFFCWRDQRATQPATENREKNNNNKLSGPSRRPTPNETSPFLLGLRPHLPPPARAGGCTWARSRPPGPRGWP